MKIKLNKYINIVRPARGGGPRMSPYIYINKKK